MVDQTELYASQEKRWSDEHAPEGNTCLSGPQWLLAPDKGGELADSRTIFAFGVLGETD